MVPLNVTSTYTLLTSTIQPTDLVTTAKELGYPAVALTDEKVLYGAVSFYRAAQEAGITPVLGLKVTVAGLPLIAYAKGAAGYRRLIKLSTAAQTKEALDLNDLVDKGGDLVIALQPAAVAGVYQDETVAQALHQLTGAHPADLYVGVTLDLTPAELNLVRQWAANHRLPLVALDPVEYLHDSDYFATRVLAAIKSGQQMDNPQALAAEAGEASLKPAAAFQLAYEQAGLAEAVANTDRLAAECPLAIDFQAPVLPHFATPNGQTSADYLRQLCQAGLAQRHLTAPEYQERLNHELGLIHQLGFDDYFLIVGDVMRFAHDHQITTGPGRGSAAGSLVAYALAITDVDPLRYNLLFERFLNPERAQMPDIDLDIPDNRRQEVLQYVHQKYGHQRVAQIITFGTLAARQVVRDVARVFMLPSYLTSELIQLLAHAPVQGNLTIAKALAASLPLQNLANDQPTVALLLQVAQQLEGLPRHDSIHAAGLVLADRPLVDLVPLQGGGDNGLLVTQYAKETVEAVGLLKIDFLGLRNLSIVDQAVKLVHRQQPDFQLAAVGLNDPATLQLFAAGQTDGIFQFESRGIRQVLVDLHPDQFEDLVAVNALYRPGPLDNIGHFIARKRGQEDYQLPSEELAPILQPTYGILVYQEQVMQVAATMAGFTLGQADLLRRAMSKKKAATMDQMQDRFVSGAEARGFSSAVAHQVFDYIDRFANYGFNRSHAVAYAKMAFQMAYLKVHYPAEFFTALLTIEPNFAKQRGHFADARRAGVTIVGPKINYSTFDFSLQAGRIVTGFGAIKGQRRDFSEAIITARQAGPFQNIYDFLKRTDERWHRQELIEPLVAVGAFDGLGYNRAELLAGLPGLLNGGEYGALDPSLQTKVPTRPDLSLGQRLDLEEQYLGVYLSGHPARQYHDLLNRLGGQMVAELRPGMAVTLVLLLTRVRVVTTKKTQQEMAFATGSDESGAINLTIFSRQYQRFAKILQQRSPLVAVRGKCVERDGELEVIVDQLQLADRFTATRLSQDHRWVVRLRPENQTTGGEQLQAILKAHPGPYPVVVYNVQTQQASQLPTGLAHDEATRAALMAAVGSTNVVFQEILPKK